MQTWKRIKNNPELLQQYLVREKVIDAVRLFFKSQKFHEVFTPILVPVPSTEPNLEVFKSELITTKGIKRNSYLIMSPEYSIKKLLAAGIGNCFEITKCFRNKEEVSSLHNPEFTMLEWYRVKADYTDIMTDFEQLFVSIIKSLIPNINLAKWEYQGKYYDITLPWPRVRIEEAFKKYAKEDVLKVTDEDFYKIYFNEVEPHLTKAQRPFFLYDYPISQASLSRSAKDSRFAERFEVFLGGVELGNCFSELTDAVEQKKRFEMDKTLRQAQGKTEYPIDDELIDALESGLPRSAGIAVGIDRLIMLAANVTSVSQTFFFPGEEIFNL